MLNFCPENFKSVWYSRVHTNDSPTYIPICFNHCPLLIFHPYHNSKLKRTKRRYQLKTIFMCYSQWNWIFSAIQNLSTSQRTKIVKIQRKNHHGFIITSTFGPMSKMWELLRRFLHEFTITNVFSLQLMLFSWTKYIRRAIIMSLFR